MNKGIFSWFGFVMPLPERLKLIKESGFDSTCLWWEDENYPKKISIDKMPTMVRNFDLTIDNIHCPYQGINGLWSEKESLRKKIIDKYFYYIEACAKHKIPNMIMHATDNLNCANKSKGIESFYTVVKRAELNGVKIAIENTKDKSIIDFTLKEIDNPFLGLCYDSSHDWIYGQSEGKLLDNWNHRLLCTHLSDNNRLEDKHWLPGDGKIRWNKIIPNILNSNINCITLEVNSSKNKISQPKEFLKIANNRLEALIKKEEEI